MRRAVVGETELRVNQIAHVDKQLQQIQRQVGARLAGFRQTLANLSTVEGEHKENEVDEMDEKLTALMGHHINLMSQGHGCGTIDVREVG